MHVQFSCVIIWIQYELVVMLFPYPSFRLRFKDNNREDNWRELNVVIYMEYLS